jgi:proprotein convertase subtilisin/kexin type 5
LCSSASSPICLKCNSGYLLSSGTCLTTSIGCPVSTYPDLNDNCASCQCLTCSGKSYNCTSCSGATSIYQNQCLSNCPTGFYSSANVCTTCSTNCAQCNSSTYCILCYLPYALSLVSNISQCLVLMVLYLQSVQLISAMFVKPALDV